MKIVDLRNEIDSFKEKIENHEDEIINKHKKIKNMNDFMMLVSESEELIAAYNKLIAKLDTKEEQSKLKSELMEHFNYLSYLKELVDDLFQYYNTFVVDNSPEIEKDWNNICTLIADHHNNEVIDSAEKLSKLYSDNKGFVSIANYFRRKCQGTSDDVLAAQRDLELKNKKRNAFLAQEKEDIKNNLKIDEKKFDAMESLDEKIDYLKKVMHNLETSKGRKKSIVIDVDRSEKRVLAGFELYYTDYNTRLTALLYEQEMNKKSESILQEVNTPEKNEEYNLDFASELVEKSPVDTVESTTNVDDFALDYVDEFKKEEAPLVDTVETEDINFDTVSSMAEKDTMKENQEMDEIEEEIRNMINRAIHTPGEKTIPIFLKNCQSINILESDWNNYSCLVSKFKKNNNLDRLEEIITRVKATEDYLAVQSINVQEINAEFSNTLKNESDNPNEEMKNNFDSLVTPEEIAALLSDDLYEAKDEEKTSEIDWEKVSKMYYKERYDYFNAIAEQILKYSEENPNNQISIELGGYPYIINAAYEELFKMCHQQVEDAWNIGHAALELDKVNRTLLGVSNTDVKQNKKQSGSIFGFISKIESKRKPKNKRKFISKIKSKRKPENTGITRGIEVIDFNIADSTIEKNTKKQSLGAILGRVALAAISSIFLGASGVASVNEGINVIKNEIASDEDSVTKLLGEDVNAIKNAIVSDEEIDSITRLLGENVRSLISEAEANDNTLENEVSMDEVEANENSYTVCEENNYINLDENWFITDAPIYTNMYDAAAQKNQESAYFPADSKHNIVGYGYEYEGKLLLLDPQDPDYLEKKEYYESRGAKFIVTCTYNENSNGCGYEGYYNMKEVEELQRGRHL